MYKYNVNKIINWIWYILIILFIVGCVKVIYHDKVIIKKHKALLIDDTLCTNKEMKNE